MTQTDNQNAQTKNKTEFSEDDIRLVDLLKVVWKWKYLILTGTAACLAITAIVIFNMPEIYEVRMALMPAIKKIDTNDRPVFIDSPENLKSLIEGELKHKIFDDLNHTKGKSLPLSLNLRVTADNNINTLSVLSEASDKAIGVKILNDLINILAQRYEKKIDFLKGQNESDLNLTKQQLAFSEAEEEFLKTKITTIQGKLDVYPLDTESEKNYPDTQNRSMKSLTDFASIVEIMSNLKMRHRKVSSEIFDLKQEIKKLETDQDNIQPLQIVQSPIASPDPIQPRIKRYLMLSIAVGFFTMLLIVFFIEYILNSFKKYKEE